ncbi:MAG: hypothetical protein EBU49_05695 [Proteobacteria bacterium]|nr:hypothetical protein [Pseudomonadota bacterium]
MLNGILDALKSLIPARVELFHPLVVHFPVALLMTATAIWFFAYVADGFHRDDFAKLVRRGSCLLMGLGLMAGLVALKTGELAEDTVNQIICDPTITKDHEDWADWAMVIFSSGLAAAAGAEFISMIRRFRTSLAPMRTIASLGFFAGAACLTWTGHLGGKLVYEQGAAVKNAQHEPCPD